MKTKTSRFATIFQRAQKALNATKAKVGGPVSSQCPAAIAPVAVRGKTTIFQRAEKALNAAKAKVGGPVPLQQSAVIAAPVAAKSAPMAAALPTPTKNSAPVLPAYPVAMQNPVATSDSAIAAQYRGVSGTAKFNFFRANSVALKRESAREKANGSIIKFFARSVIRIFPCGDGAKKLDAAAALPHGEISKTAAGFQMRILPCRRK